MCYELLFLEYKKKQPIRYLIQFFLYLCSPFSGRSVARLSRLLWEQEVAGSNPAAPTRVS